MNQTETEIYSPQFKQYETSFLHWLQTLGYSQSTIAPEREI